jgi:hypothetical protein
MRKRIAQTFRLMGRMHFIGALVIVVFATSVIAAQISDRRGFANSELHQDVMERWGAPIDQPAPSVRYVESGTVFTSLTPLQLERQRIRVDATMNYRKRGLVYFSGFDFDFHGDYAVSNPLDRAIDIVFVFPVALDRNRVLLQGLSFTVNGEEQEARLGDDGSELLWTGRLESGESAEFAIRFAGRGLDSMTYRLDPSLPAQNFTFDMRVRGGNNFDYPGGVVPAHDVMSEGDAVTMRWAYPALESGVPVGTILPSEQSFDELIATMAARAWVPFCAFLIALSGLAFLRGRELRFYESYLVAAAYGFHYVLLAYFAAFMNFYAAYALTTLLIGALLCAYGAWILGRGELRLLGGMAVAFLLVPNAAVLVRGYTGLIYALEILSALATVMFLSSRSSFDETANVLLGEELGHGA